MYSKKAGQMIPVLSVVDDGHGMSHIQILRMLSLGHKQPYDDDPHHIGRFGVGFKVLFYTFHTENLYGQKLFSRLNSKFSVETCRIRGYKNSPIRHLYPLLNSYDSCCILWQKTNIHAAVKR